jgi:hypothetical protein
MIGSRRQGSAIRTSSPPVLATGRAAGSLSTKVRTSPTTGRSAVAAVAGQDHIVDGLADSRLYLD